MIEQVSSSEQKEVFTLTENIQSLGGYEMPIYYSERNMLSLIEHHKRIGLGNLSLPYWDFTSKNERPVLEIKLEGINFKAGSIGAFTTSEMAAFLQEQSWNYEHQDTMGKDFPKGSVEAETELLRIFLGGFSSDDVIISAYGQNGEGVKPIGGSRIVFGSGDKSLLQSAFTDASSLPTFQSVTLTGLDPDFNSNEINIPEKKVACITRFWGQRRDVADKVGITRVNTPADVIALMGPSYVMCANQKGNIIPNLALFDIHNGKVFDFVREYFGAKLVANGDKVKPAAEVLQTVLKYHYGNPNIGGYQGKINIGIFKTENLLQKAKVYWQGR